MELVGLYKLSKYMREKVHERIAWAVKVFNEHHKEVGVIHAQAFLIGYSGKGEK
jgi:hypothetical protein